MTSISRNHVYPIEDTPCTSQHYRIKGFKGDPKLGSYYTERYQSLGQKMLSSFLFQTAVAELKISRLTLTQRKFVIEFKIEHDSSKDYRI